MKIIFPLILLLSFSINMFSAAPGSITGKAKDAATLDPLPAATATLLRYADSSLYKGVVAEADGAFSFSSVEPAYYLLKVSYAGYEPYFMKIESEPVRAGIDAGDVLLYPESGRELEVTGTKSQVTYSAGKKIFNVDQNTTVAGGTALDVLKQVPSVNVDQDGNVTLRGSGGVNIMLDNKPISAYGDPALVLKSLPATILDKVEVMTNPGAKYDAEGQSGIINIVLKKQRNDGFNGMVNMSTGWYDNYNGSGSFNLKEGDVNYFANFDYYFSRHLRVKTVESSFDNGVHLYRDGYGYYKGDSFGGKAGADISFDESNSLSFSGDIRRSNGVNKDPFFNIFSDSSGMMRPDYYINMDQDNEGPYNTTAASLNYMHKFETPGSQVSFDTYLTPTTFDISNRYIFSQTDAQGVRLEGTPLTGRSSRTRGDSYYLQLQSDYILPLTDTTKFEAGVKAILQGINSEFIFSELDNTSGDFIFNPDLSNKAEHVDNVYAAYINFSDKYGDFGVQAGLRGEHTTNSFVNADDGSLSFSRAFGNLFPSLALSYSVGPESNLQLSYSKRINRPHAQLLNPYLDKTDSLNWRTGNPKLMPVYIHAMEFGYMHYLEKATLNAEVFYRLSTNLISQRFREQISGAIMQEKPYNFGEGSAYGLSGFANVEIMQGFNMNGELTYYYQKAAGDFAGQSFNSTGYGWNAKISATAVLPGEINAQVYYDYTAPEVLPQGKRWEFSIMTLALSKDFFDKKMTLGFNWTDCLNTARFGGLVSGTGFTTELLNQRNFQLVSLNLSFKINEYKRQRRGGGGQGGGGGEGGGI